MSIRKIMVPLAEADSARRAFAAAASVARRFDSHIDAVFIKERPDIPAGSYGVYPVVYGEETLEALRRSAQKHADAMSTLFDELAGDHDLPVVDAATARGVSGPSASFRMREGVSPDDYAASARISDLSVVAAARMDPPTFQLALTEELIFQSGRPVLVAGERFVDPVERIAVAWNGGREAARALGAAMPFLAAAKEVTLASVDKVPYANEPLESAADYLAMHGVAVKVQVLDSALTEQAGAVFEAFAKSAKADMIVMGGYSHSRFREMVLGGFTRHMLRRGEISVLLAH